jgi:hypothetical protein
MHDEAATTRPEDLELVYGLIRSLGPPNSVHYDASEIITGLFSLPMQNDTAVVVEQPGRALDERNPLIGTVEREIPLRRLYPKLLDDSIGEVPAMERGDQQLDSDPSQQVGHG